MKNPLKSIFNRQFLAVISGMLLVIMVVIWWNTKPNSRVVQSSEQISTIASSIRKSYLNKVDYWGLSKDIIISNNILTNRFYKDNKVINALGKEVLIGQGPDGDMIMPGRRSFDITYNNLTQSECIALASFDYGQEEIGLLQITIINSEESREFTWGAEDYRLPILRPEARKICRNNSKVMWSLE